MADPMVTTFEDAHIASQAHTVRIYGASDDLIEVEGDIREEFGPPYDADHSLIACSNGVLLRIAYTDDGDGIWRITPLLGADQVSIWQCPLDDDKHYSDVATITGPLTWVALAADYAKKD